MPSLGGSFIAEAIYYEYPQITQMNADFLGVIPAQAGIQSRV